MTVAASSKADVLTGTASWPNNIFLNNSFTDNTLDVFESFLGNSLFSETCSVGGSGGQGSSSISINEFDHKLIGHSQSNFFSLVPNSDCSVTATMSGTGVSESGTDTNCNSSVQLESTSYVDDAEYCIVGSHTFPNGPCNTQACIVTPKPKVTAIVFEQIATDDLPIDENPNIGGGYRIYPDDKIPDDTVDRRKIRVKAQYSKAQAGVKIYFRNFDADDPSADTTPIDPNDTPTVKSGGDNNGLVDDTAGTGAGVLSIPTGASGCQKETYGASCETDSSGIAAVDFTITMQPGDNFVVAASTDPTYIQNLAFTSNGIDLINTTGGKGTSPIPATMNGSNDCQTGYHQACRTDILTVWRRLHIEVDTMENIDESNHATGVFAASGTINTGLATLPVTISDLEEGRFARGRIVFDNSSLPIVGNSENNITIQNDQSPVHIDLNQSFILYDDDDFNDSEGQQDLHGDALESITKLNDIFYFLQSNDNYYGDGSPANALRTSYIMPDMAWAFNRSYNQANISFDLNVEYSGSDAAEVDVILNQHRNSSQEERDDFWIGYFVLGYQGRHISDFDGYTIFPDPNDPNQNLMQPESGDGGVTSGFAGFPHCDCLNSPTCPSNAMCTAVPRGGEGSIIFQEVDRDVFNYFRFVVSTRETAFLKVVSIHELGHQFGLLGDNTNSTVFQLMDYPDYEGGVDSPTIGFNPQHINILRHRIKSPGQN